MRHLSEKTHRISHLNLRIPGRFSDPKNALHPYSHWIKPLFQERLRSGCAECQNRSNYSPILGDEELFSLFVAAGKAEGILPAGGKALFNLGLLHHPQIATNDVVAAEVRCPIGFALPAAVLARTQCD
jgi:hypothetical protein